MDKEKEIADLLERGKIRIDTFLQEMPESEIHKILPNLPDRFLKGLFSNPKQAAMATFFSAPEISYKFKADKPTIYCFIRTGYAHHTKVICFYYPFHQIGKLAIAELSYFSTYCLYRLMGNDGIPNGPIMEEFQELCRDTTDMVLEYLKQFRPELYQEMQEYYQSMQDEVIKMFIKMDINYNRNN